MSPRHHFADYMRDDPKGYQTFSDNLWNSFVTVTHAIGLSPYFSFTPEFSAGSEELSPGQPETPGDPELKYTQLPLW